MSLKSNDSSMRGILPQRRTETLHAGRESIPGARYFVTFATIKREPWLQSTFAIKAMLTALLAWHDENDGLLLAGCVMPDHVHMLFRLGPQLNVGRCVARWKSQVRRACGYTGGWQRDFWEHRIRPDEEFEAYGLYLFLNPYRAGLINADQSWSGWICPEPAQFRFSNALHEGGIPPKEWLDWPEERFENLKVGG